MQAFNKLQEDRWYDDPSNWILGVFYFNKKDKRIFVSKKNRALGWTIDIANFNFILSLILIVLFIVAFKLMT